MNNLLLNQIVALLLFIACVPKIDTNESLNSLVEAERSFSKTSVEQGIRDAFLTYLADDAIVFRPQPVKGKPLYAERKQIPGTLRWKPIYAEIAASSDFGYTTGPFEYRNNSESEKADGCGFYVSVWKKQSDGTWRVLIDAGINCPCPDTTISEIIINRQRQKPTHKTMSRSDFEAEKTKLMDLDTGFSNQVAQQGIVNAFQAFSADEIRYYRVGEIPIIGKENVCKKYYMLNGVLSWKPMASNVAKSGDLGYTYGLADFTIDNGDKNAYSYLRIWKKTLDGGWKIVLDLANIINEKKNDLDE